MIPVRVLSISSLQAVATQLLPLLLLLLHRIPKKMAQVVLNERKIASTLNHPSVTRLEFCFTSPSSAFEVFELYSGGSIFHHICNSGKYAPEISNAPRWASGKKGLNEKCVKFWGAEVLSGLIYLHKHGILHRDLKAENIGILHLYAHPVLVCLSSP